ncbi:MAG: hypothetical protein LOX97_02105 [Sphingomonas sp.]|nr:hypothetical protein [Sphingomonas sp.]
MRRTAALALLLLAAAPAAAKPGLIVRPGESWTFAIARGQPADVRKSSASAMPGPGRIHVTVRSLMGTTLAIRSAREEALSYRAELIAGGKSLAARSCTLPAGGKLSLENWKESAEAVRLSNFKPVPKGGSCP